MKCLKVIKLLLTWDWGAGQGCCRWCRTWRTPALWLSRHCSRPSSEQIDLTQYLLLFSWKSLDWKLLSLGLAPEIIIKEIFQPERCPLPSSQGSQTGPPTPWEMFKLEISEMTIDLVRPHHFVDWFNNSCHLLQVYPPVAVDVIHAENIFDLS